MILVHVNFLFGFEWCDGGSCVPSGRSNVIATVQGGWSDWKNKPCSSGCLTKSKGVIHFRLISISITSVTVIDGKQERSSVKGSAIIQHPVTCCIAAKAPVSRRPFATTTKFAPVKHASLRPNMLASNAPSLANMCHSSMVKALACRRPTLKVIFKS